MSTLEEYLIAIAVCSPLIMFIIAVAFRLLDNSTAIFLSEEIIVDSSYASVKHIKKHIKESDSPKIKKKLKRALIFRILYNVFLVLTILSIPLVIVCFFMFWQ